MQGGTVALGEDASAPRMIQMPVTHQDVIDGLEADPCPSDTLGQRAYRQPRVDQYDRLVGPEES